MANKIQIRRDTTANWTVSDPILSQGELGLDTTLNKIKIGNGTSHWSELDFFIGDTDSRIANNSGMHAVSVSNTGVITMDTSRGSIEFGALPEVGGTNHFHIMKSATPAGNVDLYFGDDYNYMLQRNQSYGNLPAFGVEIGTNDTIGGDQNVWRFGTNGDLTLADNGGIVFDRNNTSIRVGMGFHIASGEGISLEAIDQTDPNNLITKGWNFSTSGVLTVPEYEGNRLFIQGGEIGSAVSGSVVALTGNNAPVIINTYNPTLHTWTFGTDGKLTLPAASLIVSETSSVISVGAGLAALETTYLESMVMLNDVFTVISSEPGYPWGITLPISVPLTYNQLIQLLPDTFTGQDNATVVAHNATTAYNVWQDAADVTNIQVNVSDKSWVFGNDSKLTLPGGNAQIVAESTGGVRIGTADTNAAPNAQIRIGGVDHVFEIFGGSPAYSWKFDINGKLTLPGTTYDSTSPNYIHAEYGIGLHPTHNTGGTGPELYVSYNDGILVQPVTNDYLQGGIAAASLFINGSDLPNNSNSIGKLPGDIFIESGTNYQDSTHGKVVIKTGTNQWSFGTNGKLTLPTNGTVSYVPTTTSDWAGTPPSTLQEAIDRLAAAIKALNTTGT